MAGTKLAPEKITSPIQLMAAWFSMLVLITTVLLTAAIKISDPKWAAAYLVIFSSIVVVMVLVCVFLMLTKFRPHLQDGKEYARWLKDKNSYSNSEDIEKFQPRRIGIKPSSLGDDARDKRRVVVEIVLTSESMILLQHLVANGFNARIYEEHYMAGEVNLIEEHEAIWLGSRVPYKDAAEIIKLSIEKWPHLKYVELSSDSGNPPDEIHDEIFIGGTTSTAIENGLQPWSLSDFAKLESPRSLRALHAVIRGKYGKKGAAERRE